MNWIFRWYCIILALVFVQCNETLPNRIKAEINKNQLHFYILDKYSNGEYVLLKDNEKYKELIIDTNNIEIELLNQGYYKYKYNKHSVKDSIEIYSGNNDFLSSDYIDSNMKFDFFLSKEDHKFYRFKRIITNDKYKSIDTLLLIKAVDTNKFNKHFLESKKVKPSNVKKKQ